MVYKCLQISIVSFTDCFVYRRYRYTAYRQLIRWSYGYLGQEVRVVIPACAVNKIRETFGSVNYTGFLPVLN